MNVVAHGKVDDYCAEHRLRIVERYTGKLEDYEGRRGIVVTDNCSDQNDYYYLRDMFRSRGVELVSTHWFNEDIECFLEYKRFRDTERRVKKGGRQLFGTQSDRDMAVVRRIIEMRDLGYTLRRIADAPDVCYADGRRMAVSTIQVILKNRGRYGL